MRLRCAKTIAPVEEKLRAEMKRVLGEKWCRDWFVGIPEYIDVPGKINILEVLRLWTYAKALVRFRKEGDTNTARKELSDALDANGMVPQYLLKKKELPPAPPPNFRPGSEDEAVVTTMELLKSWEATPGAVFWLTEQRRKRRERDERKKK